MTKSPIMGKSTLATVLCFAIIFIAMPPIQGLVEGPKEVMEWLQNLSHAHAKQKVTTLHFYVHMEHYGAKNPNPNTAIVAQANISATSPTSFGTIKMMDAPSTVGPEKSSSRLGYAQGFIANDNLEERGLMVATNFVLTKGKYNGSSITILGHNPIMHPSVEIPIVGGSGVFRLARGAVFLKTIYLNIAAGNSTVQVDVAALHY